MSYYYIKCIKCGEFHGGVADNINKLECPKCGYNPQSVSIVKGPFIKVSTGTDKIV